MKRKRRKTVISDEALNALGIPPRLPADPEKFLYRRLYRTEDELANGRYVSIETYGAPKGTIPNRPQWLVCDCCNRRADRFWIFRHYGFGIVRQNRVFDAGGWGFCVQCYALKNNLEILIARVMTLNPDLDQAAVREVYRVAFACFYGEVIEWQSGQPYPELAEKHRP